MEGHLVKLGFHEGESAEEGWCHCQTWSPRFWSGMVFTFFVLSRIQVSWPGMVLLFTVFVLVRTCGRTNVRRNQGVMLKGNSLHKVNRHSSTPQTSFPAFFQVQEFAFFGPPTPGMTLHQRFLMRAVWARLEPRARRANGLTLTLPHVAARCCTVSFALWPKKTELRNQLLYMLNSFFGGPQGPNPHQF